MVCLATLTDFIFCWILILIFCLINNVLSNKNFGRSGYGDPTVVGTSWCYGKFNFTLSFIIPRRKRRRPYKRFVYSINDERDELSPFSSILDSFWDIKSKNLQCLFLPRSYYVCMYGKIFTQNLTRIIFQDNRTISEQTIQIGSL